MCLKCNFPITYHVLWSGMSVRWSVCHNFFKERVGSYTSVLLPENLLELWQSFKKRRWLLKRLQPNVWFDMACVCIFMWLVWDIRMMIWMGVLEPRKKPLWRNNTTSSLYHYPRRNLETSSFSIDKLWKRSSNDIKSSRLCFTSHVTGPRQRDNKGIREIYVINMLPHINIYIF